MSRKILLTLTSLYLLLLTACVPLGTLQIEVETEAPVVTENPSAEVPYPEPIVTEEPAPVSTTGTVSGKLCYPSEFIPAMTIYFQQAPDSEINQLETIENQSTYSVELAPGTYRAFAWVEYLAGGYTDYVACGFADNCTNHALQTFEVVAGQETLNIDICDWPLTTEQLPLPKPASDEDPSAIGMIYTTQEGTHYRVNADGTETNIYSVPGMIISPDGTRGLSSQENDLFILNLSTGEQFNLTNTPGDYEVLFQWPLPETIFFTVMPAGEIGGPGMTGGLYSIQSDGTGFTALDPATNAGSFAVSPDGQYVAYGAGPEASVLEIQSGQIQTFPSDFGITCPSSCSPSSPAWSPDGQKLAWWVQGEFNGQGSFAVGVFDLNAKTVELIHPYPIVGRDGFLPAPKFSPDGNWIAFEAFDIDASRSGVWVVSVGDPNQSTEMFLGAFSYHPLWSPHGRWMAFHSFDQTEQIHRVMLYDLFNNAILQAYMLPINVTVIDW